MLTNTDPRDTHTLTTAAFPDEVLVGDKSKDWKISLLEERLESRIAITQKLEADLAKRETMISELIIEKESAESAMDNLARKLTETETLHSECFSLAIQHQNRANAAEEEVALKARVNESLDRENTRLAEEVSSLRSQLAMQTDETNARRAWNDRVEAATKDVFALRHLAWNSLDTAIYKLWLATEGTPSMYPAVVVPTAPVQAGTADAPSISPMGETKASGPACEGCDHCDPAVTDEFLKAADIEANALVFAAGCDADDLATTAVDMDVARRHGRICRLHKAGESVKEAYYTGEGMTKATNELFDILDEFSPDDLGQIPPETKADRMISELRGMTQRLSQENAELKHAGNEMRELLAEYRGPVWTNTLNSRCAHVLEKWSAATKENPRSNSRFEAAKKFDTAITKYSENY